MGTTDVDPFRIESRLTSHGVYVTDFEREDDAYRVEYESLAADDGTIPHQEVGRVVNVFLDLHPDDWAGADIEGIVTDLDGTRQATWHVEAEWLGQLTEYRLSEVEFSERVVDTIEPAAEPAEPVDESADESGNPDTGR